MGAGSKLYFIKNQIANMNKLATRKYEITYLVFASLLIALASNLPFYSLYFNLSSGYQMPESSLFEKVYKISWYTGQLLVSILLLSFYNYYWRDYLISKKCPLLIKILLGSVYNIIIVIGLFKASFYIGGITVGHPFSEEFAFKYYTWKYIYITPSSVAIAFILDLIIRKRAVELNNAKLKEENLSNQLKTLKDQIKPHFLFNTLNTLSELIRNESREVGLKFVDDLAIVYRYILEKSNYDLVDLSVELDFANSYTRLVKKRFHNKIDVEINISDKYMVYRIPPLTLLLLIENAIKHNEVSEASPLNIKIDIHHKYLRIENNLNPKNPKPPSLGIGLQNLSQRYSIITNSEIVINSYPDKFTVQLPLINNRNL